MKPYTAQLPLFKISCHMTLEGAWGHILGQEVGPGLRTRHVSEPLHVHASPPWAEPDRAAKHGRRVSEVFGAVTEARRSPAGFAVAS